MADAQTRLREALAAQTNTAPGDWHLVLKCRHGMLVVLRELAQRYGKGTVITQLLTCCTAVDPIVAAGLTPVYGDVSLQTFALDAAALRVSELPVAIVDQHTFGYIDRASSQALRAVANSHSALLLEDCAHCVGRMATDDQGRPLADFSFHSFGVEKMLPTYFGGAVWVNPQMEDAKLRNKVTQALESLPEPQGKLARAMRGYRTQIRALNHLPAPLSRGVRSALLALEAFEPAIAECERKGAVAHEPQAAGEWAASQVVDLFEALPNSYDLRISALDSYAQELSDIEGIGTSQAMLASGQPLLRVPVNMASNEAANVAIQAIASAGLYAVPWYRPLLYPGVSDKGAYAWDGTLQNLPHTAALSHGAVALPCDLTKAQVHDVACALREAASAT